MLLLESYYSIYLAGVPGDLNMPADVDPAQMAPYAGCIRDVIIETAVAQLNAVPHVSQGIQLGQCPEPAAPSSKADSEDFEETTDTDTGKRHHFLLY